MQTYYASDSENAWHWFIRGGVTNLGDTQTNFNMMFFGRGGRALWGQECGIVTASIVFLGMMEGGSNDTYVADFMKHFENGLYPSPWALSVYNSLKQNNYHYDNWGDYVSAYSMTRGSFMCHGIREKCRKVNFTGNSISGLCAQASIATAVEFVFKYLNWKMAGGSAPDVKLQGYQTTVGGSCTTSNCHAPIANLAKSNCRVCHK